MMLVKVEYEFFDYEEPSREARELDRQILLQFADTPALYVSWTWERQIDPDSEPYSISYSESSYFTDSAAHVIDASEADCLLMSLVENIARRPHRPIDLMAEIGNLAKRGQSDAEIAEKIGVSRGWVHNVLVLLERGEERLVSAAETGLIPIAMAAEIAMAKEEEVQTILMEAYESGKIKGKKVSAIRRLLDLRTVGESLSCSVDTVDRMLRHGQLAYVRLPGGRRRVTPEDLDAAIQSWRRVEKA